MNSRALAAFLLSAAPAAAQAPPPDPTSAPSSQPSSVPSSQPSSRPSRMPSSIPSEMPSSIPSKIPSTMPSTIPSKIPSRMPSSIPSEMPSSIPSKIPSRMPSSIPSESPSSVPSKIPSAMPSTIPSKFPSRMPSSIPSSMPSSIPSKIPSRMPSSIPSSMPSSIPSEMPSRMPSSIPSSQPSCQPSESPSDPATSFLFYPDWSAGGTGCKNDGNEPSYMTANPSYYLSSTLDKCCSTYFSWNLNVCLNQLRGICARLLYYPDWDGANTGCIDDGNEPKYMTDNPVGYLYESLADCCEQHYFWDKTTCLGAAATQNTKLWYPDWGGADNVCKTGGGQPKYMNTNPTIWMHATLRECCTQNYSWNFDECISSHPSGSSSSGSSSTSGLYYPDWSSGSDNVCKNDGNQPNYMTQNPSNWMYSTLAACCSARFGWDPTCLTASGGTGGTSTTAAAGTGRWYKRSEDWICVQDCVGVDPCGGLADPWEETDYATRKECCNSMVDDDCMTRAITGG